MNWPANAETVRELVAGYYERLYRYAYRLTGRADEAEDLTQEAFCRAQMQWRQLKDPARPGPWLFAILRNCFLRGLRDARRANSVPLTMDLNHQTATASDADALDPGELQKLLNGLPESYRTPLILFYFEEFTYREIAEHMDVPIGTVMSRLARAKTYLREQLEKSHVDTTGGQRGV